MVVCVCLCVSMQAEAVYGCVRVQGYMWRAFAEFESREGDPLVARHYYARAVNAEVCTATHASDTRVACAP